MDFFNPGSNTAKVSILRLANPNASPVSVSITGLDDAGEPGEDTLHGSLPAQAGVTLTAQKLEAGEGNPVTGRLGDGAGKWRLTVRAAQPVLVMSLLHATQSAFNALVLGKRVQLSDSVIRFMEGNRLRQTFTAFGVSLSRSYTYRKTGPSAATMRIWFDDDQRCDISLICTSHTAGTLGSSCRGGASEDWRILP